jgi:hypothetical protein
VASQVDPSLLNARGPKGATALHVAARYGHTRLVSQLLKAGADLLARDASGKSALDKARQLRHHDVLAALTAATSDEQFGIKTVRLSHGAVAATVAAAAAAASAVRVDGAGAAPAALSIERAAKRLPMEAGVAVDDQEEAAAGFAVDDQEEEEARVRAALAAAVAEAEAVRQRHFFFQRPLDSAKGVPD